jgi:multidrug efflux pump subunit AcrA (membrane-fusion protein)
VLSHATVDAYRGISVNVGADIAAEHATLATEQEVVRLTSTSTAAQFALQYATVTAPRAIRVRAEGASGRLMVDEGIFEDSDGIVSVEPRCLPVEGTPATGQMADACGS